jgi:phosphohistidine phosphatase
MLVHILRHAEAIEAHEELRDEWRYLTDKGMKSVEGVAKRMIKQDLKPALIISSPRVRAIQTAQIMADACGRTTRVEISGLLQPHGDVFELIQFLRQRTEFKQVMLVGHEPQLSTLTAALLHHEGARPFKKGSCVVLDFSLKKPDRTARFRCCITPGKKTVSSLKKINPSH